MSFGFKELAIILLIVLVVFGSTKLKSLGRDLGAAIKGFKSAIKDDDEVDTKTSAEAASETALETTAETALGTTADKASEAEAEVPPSAQSTASDEGQPPKS